MSGEPLIDYVDFKGPPPIGTTMEDTYGNTWELVEVIPPAIRLKWRANSAKGRGFVYMETPTAFVVHHMDLGREPEANRYFIEPPPAGTTFRDKQGWTWKVAGTETIWLRAYGRPGFRITWHTADPATGQRYEATSGAHAWGNRLHKAKRPLPSARVASNGEAPR